MAILFASNEDIDFSTEGSPPAIHTSSSNDEFDPDYARGALVVRGTAGWNVDLDTTYNDLFVRFSFNWGLVSSSHDDFIFVLYDSNTAEELFRLLAVNGDTGSNTIQLKAQYHNGSVWTDIGTMSGTCTEDTGNDLCVQISRADSSGIFKLWVNDTLEVNYTGDTNYRSAAGVDTIQFRSSRNDSDSALYDQYISEVLVTTTENPKDWRVATLVPNGSGDSTSWAGGYTDIDETDESSGDLISSTSAAEEEDFTLTNLPTLSGTYPKAVIASARCRNDGGAPTEVEVGVRISSMSYFGTSTDPSTSFTTLRKIWTTSPATATDWTETEVNALQGAVRSQT